MDTIPAYDARSRFLCLALVTENAAGRFGVTFETFARQDGFDHGSLYTSLRPEVARDGLVAELERLGYEVLAELGAGPDGRLAFELYVC